MYLILIGQGIKVIICNEASSVQFYLLVSRLYIGISKLLNYVEYKTEY